MSSKSEQATDAAPIPVFRPLLPTADRVLPYLQRVDASRIYSNYGPLSLELEQRLGEHFELPAGSVVAAASGSSALVGAILAHAGRASPARPYAIVPAFTFVGTAAVVELCGYQPYLMDVSADRWLLNPETVSGCPVIDQVGLVVPVATFGQGVDASQWHAFSARMGIPVVIDGAASFDVIARDPPRYVGDTPVAVSFHATKSFATGEGGCVLSRDGAVVSRVSASLNFGFSGTRDCGWASTNGKMSEYHAAVGLAELDGWPQKSAHMQRVADDYLRAFDEAGLAGRFYATPAVSACYSLFLCSDEGETRRACASLESAGIDYRFWYGFGLQEHSFYRDTPCDALPVTGTVSRRLLGLPGAPDLSTRAVRRVVAALSKVIPPEPGQPRRRVPAAS